MACLNFRRKLSCTKLCLNSNINLINGMINNLFWHWKKPSKKSKNKTKQKPERHFCLVSWFFKKNKMTQNNWLETYVWLFLIIVVFMRIFPKGEVLPQWITWVFNNQQSGTNNSPHCQETWFSDNCLHLIWWR